MLQRIYIDTSVIGGVYDMEFEEWSKKLVEEFKKGMKIAVLSDVTLLELANAPEKVQSLLDEIPSEYREFITLTDEARDLANKYIVANAITEKSYEDALHIAIATIDKVEILASWNFKHIVNIERIRRYNSVNLSNGYSILEIRSPREILKLEDNE